MLRATLTFCWPRSACTSYSRRPLMPARRLGCRRTALACSLLWLSTSPLCLRGILASDMGTPGALSSSWPRWNDGRFNRMLTGKYAARMTVCSRHTHGEGLAAAAWEDLAAICKFKVERKIFPVRLLPAIKQQYRGLHKYVTAAFPGQRTDRQSWWLPCCVGAAPRRYVDCACDIALAAFLTARSAP